MSQLNMLEHGLSSRNSTATGVSRTSSSKVNNSKRAARRRRRKAKPNQFILCDEWSIDTHSAATNHDQSESVDIDDDELVVLDEIEDTTHGNKTVKKSQKPVGTRSVAPVKRNTRGGKQIHGRNKMDKFIQKRSDQGRQKKQANATRDDSVHNGTVPATSRVSTLGQYGPLLDLPPVQPMRSLGEKLGTVSRLSDLPTSSSYLRDTVTSNSSIGLLDDHAPSPLLPPPTSRSIPTYLTNSTLHKSAPLLPLDGRAYPVTSRGLPLDEVPYSKPMGRLSPDFGSHDPSSLPPRPTRQLKISSLLSPKKSSENFTDRLRETERRSDPHQLGLMRISPDLFPLVDIGDRTLDPPPPKLTSVYDPLLYAPPRSLPNDVLLGRSSSSARDIDSVFSRLGSPTKLRQSRLPFGSVAKAGHIADQRSGSSLDRVSIGYGSSTSSSVLGNLSSLSAVRLGPELNSQSITGSGSNSLTKIVTEESSSLYRYKSRSGIPELNVAKLVNRFAPKVYRNKPPSTRSDTIASLPRVHGTTSLLPNSSGRTVNEIKEERVVQVSDSSQVRGPSARSVSLSSASSGASSKAPERYVDETDTHDDDVDYVRHVQDSNKVKIPVSKMGLKVVAIDCEMVGCVKQETLLPEVFLATNMKSGGAEKRQVKQSGLLGLLHRKKMKPQVASKKKANLKSKVKEVSVAARCSIIGYDGSIIYDKYIEPTVDTGYKIIAYRTPWSGIKPCHMVGATPFKQAREEVLDILSGCIVIGHHIWSDFHALEINSFPAKQIRDTSIYPTLKKRAGLSVDRQPGSLKKMSLLLLGRHIQKKSRVGHCSVEDATATMDLYKLVEAEWEG